MFFSARSSWNDLIVLCRTLRIQLNAGISPVRIFRQQTERGPRRLRAAAGRIAEHLQRGDTMHAALQTQNARFPSLMLTMVQVGEETGRLPEVLGQLEEHFRRQQQLQRQIRSQSLLPIIQIVFAFFLIALLIIVLGMIAQSRGTQPPRILGQAGVTGALVFLALSFGAVTALYLLYRWLASHYATAAKLSGLLLRLPGIGPCLQAIIVGRLAMALHLTLDSSLSPMKALRLSFDATDNAAFRSCADAVVRAVKAKKDISTALSRCRWLPQTFLNMAAVGEAGGRLPEVMQHQAEQYYEEASQRLKTLARMFTLGIWMAYAVFMIIAIFKIASMYLGRLGV